VAKVRHKLQASSGLTRVEGYYRIVLICSFGAFPQDKFAKAPQNKTLTKGERK